MKKGLMSYNTIVGRLRRLWMDYPFLRPLRHLSFLMAVVGLLAMLYDFGFNQELGVQTYLELLYPSIIGLELLFIGLRYVVFWNTYRRKVWFMDGWLVLTLLTTFLSFLGVLRGSLWHSPYWIAMVFLWIFIREMGSERLELRRRFLNPAQLFLYSFLLIILVGAGMLMFPNATVDGISFVDALFTSGSAVCVTGLSVVDTGHCFTLFGQVIVMVLIQLGGLGIMTFTSYFSYFFTGESSYENQLLIQEVTNSDKISDVFGTLKRVILLTFSVEALGAICIYHSLSTALMPQVGDRLFFAVFHAVSGFCNAGFSTLTNNLYEVGYRFNYPLHLIIAALIVLGGIGFPILFNFLQYVRMQLRSLLWYKRFKHQPWAINLNTRLVFITTLILLVGGTLLFYLFEYDNTLAEHGPFGKVVTAFFGAVTPRTAGFNTVDSSKMHLITVYLLYFLMWVGASPASTGGGIKTSTLAISVLNAIGLARGKDRIDLFGRQLSDSSIRRAYAQVCLSLLTIGVSVFLVSYFDPQLPTHSVIFESISAFGTVGLSLGITAKLSAASKLVITATMFIGRINLLTVFAAFMKQVRLLKYQYPSEDITIN
jgi:potassium uptake TrkH family protein